jgi:hypothetical protein
VQTGVDNNGEKREEKGRQGKGREEQEGVRITDSDGCEQEARHPFHHPIPRTDDDYIYLASQYLQYHFPVRVVVD